MEVAMSDPTPVVHQCTCSGCREGRDSQTIGYHHQMNLLLSRLNEPQRRWYVGSLSLAPDAPTDEALSVITGLDEKTIRRGRQEMQTDLQTLPPNRQRKEGGGRPALEKKTRP